MPIFLFPLCFGLLKGNIAAANHIAAIMPVDPFDIKTISGFLVIVLGPGVFIAVEVLVSQSISKI